jgi:hypothetical protein
MNQKTRFVMSAIVITAALALVFAATTSVTGAYATSNGDSSETNTEQKIRQENVGSGFSTNINCAQNLIISSGIVCFDPTVNATDDD